MSELTDKDVVDRYKKARLQGVAAHLEISGATPEVKAKVMDKARSRADSHIQSRKNLSSAIFG